MLAGAGFAADVGEELGNFYGQIYNSSTHAATLMASQVVQLASSSAALNRVITNSSYPRWFQDFLLNSLATQPKMGIWVTRQCPAHSASGHQCGAPQLQNGNLPGTTANGRYRTYEAFSGCDLDPVHVSGTSGNLTRARAR